MKKLIFGISLSMLILLLSIFIISKSKKITLEDKYYTIPQILTYHYEENKRMCFEIFINNENNLIEYSHENTYYLSSANGKYQLNEVEVTKEKNYTTKEDIFYKYSISCNILSFKEEDISFEDCYLIIENDTFHLECYIGDVEIYRRNYIPLDFTDLYGNYAYIAGELHLIGITIQLDPSYQILEGVCFGRAYACTNLIEEDQLYDSERLESSLKHTVVLKKENQVPYPLNAKQNYYFLPISYSNLALFTKGCILIALDGKTYYIEDFTYLANHLTLAGYNQTKREGKVRYA